MRRFLKILGRIAIVLAVLLLVVAVGAKLFFPLEKAKQLAIARAQDKLERPVAVGDVEVSLVGGLGLKLLDVEIGNPPGMAGQPLLTAASVDLKLALWPLLRGRIQAHRLIIDEPRLDLVQQADGSNNFTFARAAEEGSGQGGPPATGDEGLVVSFERIGVRGAQVGYRDLGTGQGLRLFGLDLVSSLANPGPNRYRAAGELDLDSLSVQGPQQPPVLPLSLEFALTYDLEQGRLSLEEGQVGLGPLALQLAGELQHGPGAVQAKGRLTAADLALADLLGLLPPARQTILADFDLAGRLGCELDLALASGDSTTLDYRGTVALTDLRCRHRPTPGELTAAAIRAQLQPDQVRIVTEQGAFEGRALRADCLVQDFSDPVVEGHLAGDIDLALVQPFLPPELEVEVAGPATFSLQANGRVKEPDALDFSGQLQVAGASLSLAALADPLTDVSLKTRIDRRTLSIEQLQGRWGASEFRCSGSLTGLLDALADPAAPRLDLAACQLTVGTELDLAQAQPYLPPEKQARLAGRLSGSVQLQGPLSAGVDLLRTGRLKISGLSYSDQDLFEPLRDLEADLELAPDLITLKQCRIDFPSSRLALKGTVRNALPYFLPGTDQDSPDVPRPTVACTVQAERLDLDRMFPQAGSGAGESGPGGGQPVELAGTGMPDIHGGGTVQVDTLVFNRVEFTRIACQVRFADRNIFCTDITGRMYQGQAAGEATFGLQDLGRPTYSGSFEATQIEADDFLRRFTPFGGMFFGKFDLTGSFGAAGREAATVRSTLTLDGQADMHDGKVVTSGFAYNALSALAGKLGQDLQKEQGLRDLKTLIKVKDGTVSMDQITTKLGQLGDLSLQGNYSFAGGIHYEGTLLLSAEQSKKLLSGGGLAGGLANILGGSKDERLALPLNLTGTLAKPQFKVDYAALAERAGQNLTDEAQNRLRDLFK